MPAYAIGFTTSSPTLTTTYVTKNGQTYPSILYQPKTNFANSGNVCGGSSGYCTYNDLIRNGVL